MIRRAPRVPAIGRITFGGAALLLSLLTAITGSAQGPGIAAEVDRRAITTAEVDVALGSELAVLQQQIDALRRKKLDELIGEELLSREATRRGVTVPQLLEAEVAVKPGEVTEEEIERLYQRNKGRFRDAESVVRGRIRATLEAERTNGRKAALVRQLRQESRVVVWLEAPKPTRLTVEARGDAAVKGPASAPVTIVEFSDFQCPFCRKTLPELDRVLAAYPREVRLVYRHFPLDALHPRARLAAQAAECAGSAGRFWEYHDLLFSYEDFSPSALRKAAEVVGLDVPRFEQCLGDERTRSKVAVDVDAGTRAGVSGTPTFFINGQRVVGAQGFETFRSMIEQELAAVKR